MVSSSCLHFQLTLLVSRFLCEVYQPLFYQAKNLAGQETMVGHLWRGVCLLWPVLWVQEKPRGDFKPRRTLLFDVHHDH